MMNKISEATLFDRQQLVDRLFDTHWLTVVVAPSGFGKTALLKAVEQRADAFGYQNITFTDRRTHNVDANLAEHHISQSVLKDKSHSSLILIDDADDCDGRSLSATLDKTDFSNKDVRVFVAMRYPEAISFSRLRANNEVTVVDSDTLQLNSSEQSKLLDRVPKLLQPSIESMAGRWPVAMKLLVDWATKAPKLSHKLNPLTINNQSGLSSYINEEILPGLSDGQLKTLLLVSLFEKIDEKMLRTLFPKHPIETDLIRLLNTHRGLINFHGENVYLQSAFRSHLMGMFKELHPKEFLSVSEQAASYLAECGNLTEAVQLASLSTKPHLIDQFVAQHDNIRIWVVHGYQVVRTIVETAGVAVVDQFPRLRLLSTIVHLKEGRIKNAERVYRDLEANISLYSELTTDIEFLRITLLVYGCSLERKGELQTFSEIVNSIEEDAAWKTLLSTLSCILHSQRGRLDQAEASLIEARVQASLAESDYNMMFSHIHESGINLAKGQLKQARTAIAKARKHWRKQFLGDDGVDTVISAFSASIEYESGRLTSARNAIRRSAKRFPHSEAWFDVYVAAYEPMFRLLALDRGLNVALELIDSQKQLLLEQGLSRVAKMLEGIHVILCAEDRLNGNASQSTLTKEKFVTMSTSTWQEFETFTFANAHIEIASGNIKEAIRLLEKEIKRATKLQLGRSRIRFSLVLSICYLALHRDSKAKQNLLTAISFGASSGQIQIFKELIHNDSLNECLIELQSDGSLNKVEKGFVQKIRSNEQKSNRKLDSDLSEREIEILTKLGEGGSDKLLARQLGISEHGVRYHLKKIYRKLSVHDRVSAVMAASAKDLIQ